MVVEHGGAVLVGDGLPQYHFAVDAPKRTVHVERHGGPGDGPHRPAERDPDEQNLDAYRLHRLPPPTASGAALGASQPVAGTGSVLARSSATSQTAMMGKILTNSVINRANRAKPAATTDISTQVGA